MQTAPYLLELERCLSAGSTGEPDATPVCVEELTHSPTATSRYGLKAILSSVEAVD